MHYAAKFNKYTRKQRRFAKRSWEVHGCLEKLNEINKNFDINLMLLNVYLVNYTKAK